MNINLFDLMGIEIERTDGSRKLTIKGETKNYTVYKIPLKYLYYNNQNGRIATWISKYTIEKGELNPEIDREEYNQILHEFIKKSNPAALTKTKSNIDSFGQRVPGVVLQNGRIIDGNRRFTCWRELAQEGKVAFFEAVILDEKTGISPKDIKRLELNLQHGEEKPVDYNPIDNLVDIYKDIVENQLFTEAEYVKDTSKSATEVSKMVEKAKLMVDFLKFINADGKYFIAREMMIDGPLQEMTSILKKASEAERPAIKNTLFAALILKSGDHTRIIREIGNDIIKTENVKNYIEEYEDTVAEVYDILKNEEQVDTQVLREKILNNEEIKEESDNIITKYVDKNRINNARMKPIVLLNTAFNSMDSIDTESVSRLSKENKQEFKSVLEKIRATLALLENKANV